VTELHVHRVDLRRLDKQPRSHLRWISHVLWLLSTSDGTLRRRHEPLEGHTHFLVWVMFSSSRTSNLQLVWPDALKYSRRLVLRWPNARGLWWAGCLLLMVMIRRELCTSYSSSFHHSPPPSSLAPIKSRMETFWYRLTRVVDNGWWMSVLLCYDRPVVILVIHPTLVPDVFQVRTFVIAGVRFFTEQIPFLSTNQQ